jgi:hypothetical protein
MRDSRGSSEGKPRFAVREILTIAVEEEYLQDIRSAIGSLQQPSAIISGTYVELVQEFLETGLVAGQIAGRALHRYLRHDTRDMDRIQKGRREEKK